jgi:hypothetical protein
MSERRVKAAEPGAAADAATRLSFFVSWLNHERRKVWRLIEENS